jgi:hypothetical protein
MEDFLWDPVQNMEEKESVLKYSSSNFVWPIRFAEEGMKCKMWNKDVTR